MRYTHSPASERLQEEEIDALASRTLTVAAVPAAHPYSRAVADVAHVRVIDDPRPPGAPAGQWWPPQVLTSGWLQAHARDLDLVHVHFGLESFTPAELAQALAALRAAGRPVVFTVHDLENPQLGDQAAYLLLLDELVPVADELITLTDGAAHEIAARWGRRARVIPHPSLLEDDAPRPTGTPASVRRVGVHLRDLRPNIDGLGTVQTLAAAVAVLRARGTEVEGVVRLNERVRDEAQAAAIADLMAEAPGAVLEREPRLDDDALADWLADLDVCLLPYRHGTHSGWVELCFDLAVTVAGPPVGHAGSQHPDDFHPFAIGDADSLATAISRAAAAGSSPGSAEREREVRARAAERAAERVRVREAHLAVYARALGVAA
ncbi:glycosyltransferase [Microbacterium sp. 1P10UB]|uniref:glycosyltransferase n=1 Tax=unclassified Microbacterium TaxID=2609290 RepID=UPI00399F6DC4